MNDSSFGSAAPKNRSINVGANLLAEWIAEQARLRREIGRYAALLGVSVLLSATVLPVLWRASTDASRQAAALHSDVKGLDAALAVSDHARKVAQPALVVEAMCGTTTASFDRLLTEVDRVLGAGNSRTAVSTFHCDVQSGEAHLVALTDAEEGGAADAFARNASDPRAKVDAITTSRPSHLLAPDGLAFVYEKRIGVGR